MRNPHAYATVIDPSASQSFVERDVFKCAHCGFFVHVKPLCDPVDMGGRCTTCEDGHGRGLICKNCVGKECTPFLRKIEAQEAAARFRASLES